MRENDGRRKKDKPKSRIIKNARDTKGNYKREKRIIKMAEKKKKNGKKRVRRNDL